MGQVHVLSFEAFTRAEIKRNKGTEEGKDNRKKLYKRHESGEEKLETKKNKKKENDKNRRNITKTKHKDRKWKRRQK